MRFIYWYLAVYFLLLFGAGVALWESGILGRISPTSLLLTAIVVVGLGVVLLITSSPSPTRN